jgi:hypothetical protein
VAADPVTPVPSSSAALIAERETLTEAVSMSAVSVNRVTMVSKAADHVQGACRDCGGQLVFEEGCVKCYSCGFTECG